MRRNIQYFQDVETGLLITRVGSYVAVPVIDMLKTLPKKDGSGFYSFKEQFPLEKHDVISVSKWYNSLKPISRNNVKGKYLIVWINYHREFWGLRKIK